MNGLYPKDFPTLREQREWSTAYGLDDAFDVSMRAVVRGDVAWGDDRIPTPPTVEFATVEEVVAAISRGMDTWSITRQLSKLPSAEARMECLRRLHPSIVERFWRKVPRQWLANWMPEA
jgi:hypothetical protein